MSNQRSLVHKNDFISQTVNNVVALLEYSRINVNLHWFESDCSVCCLSADRSSPAHQGRQRRVLQVSEAVSGWSPDPAHPLLLQVPAEARGGGW